MSKHAKRHISSLPYNAVSLPYVLTLNHHKPTLKEKSGAETAPGLSRFHIGAVPSACHTELTWFDLGSQSPGWMALKPNVY